MKIIAKSKGKGINLNPRTKPKKEDKYSEISDIKSKPKFEISDQILIYTGVEKDYRGLECTIIKRSQRKNINY